MTADILNRDNRLRQTTETTWQAVQVAIVDGEMAGEGIDKIAKRIGRVFTQAKGYRARMIARTETIGAANAGSYYGAEASGVVGAKVWLAAVDHRTRSSHVTADGQKVPLDRLFQVGAASMKYPGDPAGGPSETINCRCTVLYERAVDDVAQEDPEDEVVAVPTPASPDTPDAPPVPKIGPGRKVATAHLPDRVTKPVKRKLDRRLQRYVEVGGEEIGTGTKVHKGVKAAQARIDEVHSAPEGMKSIPIQQTSGEKTLGSYRYGTRTGEAMDLNVSSAKSTQASVFTHEFGHYFDHQDFGKAGAFSSVEAANGLPDAVLAEWWDAIQETEAIKTLRDYLPRKDNPVLRITHVMPDGRVIEVRPNYDYIRYLLDPREMFARSYAQWIATETGDAGLLKEILEDETFGPYPGQWSPEDFAPLAKAFRKVFKAAGLIE